jgi:hypothetical protein
MTERKTDIGSVREYGFPVLCFLIPGIRIPYAVVTMYQEGVDGLCPRQTAAARAA